MSSSVPTSLPHGLNTPFITGGGNPASYNGGNVLYVSSVNGNGNNDGKTPDHALLTIAAAVTAATANNGDVIVLLPGHAETISAAAGIALNKAGLTILGFGNGANRPTITFDTLVGADLDVTAANVKLINILFDFNKDALTNPLHIAAADCEFRNCEFRDRSSLIEAARAILTTAAADRFRVIDCLFSGQTGGDASVNGMRLVGVNEGLVQGCRFQGKVSTAWIEFETTACTLFDVVDCIFHVSGTTDVSKNVVDTITGSTWSAFDCFDLGAGAGFSGGSGATPAVDDLSAVSSKVTSVGTQVSAASSTVISAHVVTDSKVTSVGTLTSTATSTVNSAHVVTDSKVTSVGTAASTAASTTDSTVVSAHVVTDSKVTSVGTLTSTATSTVNSAHVVTDSKVTSVGTQVSTATSTVNSAHVVTDSKVDSAGTSVSTATSTVNSAHVVTDSKVTSVGTLTSTATSTVNSAHVVTDSKVDSVGTNVSAIGRPVGKTGTFADNTLTNNTQVVTLVTATAGDIYIEQVVLEKDATLLAGPTNIELSTDNVYGLTGVDDPIAANVVGGLGVNDTLVASAMGVVAMKAFVLESTKKIFIHGNDGVGSSAGNIRYSVIGRALSAGATLA